MKTSINIQPIKPTSEQHNTRAQLLDYVHSELTTNNECWSVESISDRLDKIRNAYTTTTGQPMQKKATPIREGVVVISPDTTMENLKLFAKVIEERFKIKTFQIHIHRDEGKSVEQLNHHAHMVFDWTQTNGKSVKLQKHDMSEMQSLLAESLSMERGSSSDRKHLGAIEYKIKAQEKKLKEQSRRLDTVKEAIKQWGEDTRLVLQEYVVELIRVFRELLSEVNIEHFNHLLEPLFKRNEELVQENEILRKNALKIEKTKGKEKLISFALNKILNNPKNQLETFDRQDALRALRGEEPMTIVERELAKSRNHLMQKRKNTEKNKENNNSLKL